MQTRRAAISAEAFVPLLLLAIYLIWGFAYVAVRIAVRDAPPFTVAAGRALLAAATLGLAALALGRPFPRARRSQLFAAVVGLLNVSGLAGFMSLGLSLVPAGESSLVTYTQPLQVALLSVVLLHERLTGRQVVGLALGFAGVVVVLLPRLGGGSAASPLGYAALLVGAFTWALSAVLFRRGPARLLGGDRPVERVDVFWLVALQAAYGAVPLLAAGVLLEGLHVRWTGDLIWSWLFAGVGAGGVANLLWFYLLSKRSATVVAAYVFLVPAFAVAFGGVVLGEPITATLAAGGALTLGGIALVTRT